jgi:hypothetical protein
MTFDSTGNRFVADNTNSIHRGSIYEYHPDGSRLTFRVLAVSDRPAGLAFDSRGNLLMGDLGGTIYKYLVGVLGRRIFGSVPNGVQSLACDSAGNLFVVNAGNGNVIYKFTMQGVRSVFRPWGEPNSTLAYIAAQPPACCQ